MAALWASSRPRSLCGPRKEINMTVHETAAMAILSAFPNLTPEEREKLKAGVIQLSERAMLDQR